MENVGGLCNLVNSNKAFKMQVKVCGVGGGGKVY